MAGQATYCAAKAGMDNLSRAVALDQALIASGAKVVSLAPGVIDTDMQTQLRGSSDAGFPERQTFVKLKESGQLSSSRDAAARLVAYLGRADFGANPVADVRDP
jgi:NAD(P)-dependent dehydrogenase (short-subunit alcohol dehydrogenase family)